ncbi:MAG: hypothetical protein CSA24_02450 [Deltaproteobacteria bacterium]|nr:MAG: hypothetical protein CSA24_02450 [Deltaproteobacteria bacterium]
MGRDYEKQQLIQWLRAEMSRAAGRAYPRLGLNAIDKDSLRELQRLLRDLDAERRMAVQRARMMPWREP